MSHYSIEHKQHKQHPQTTQLLETLHVLLQRGHKLLPFADTVLTSLASGNVRADEVQSYQFRIFLLERHLHELQEGNKL